MYDRQYKAYRLSDTPFIKYIKQTINYHEICGNLLIPVSLYIRNKLVIPTNEAIKDLKDYNSVPEFIRQKINLDDNQYELNIIKITNLLNVTKEEIINFVTNSKYSYTFISNMVQVISEQSMFINNEPYYNNSWYLEIYGKYDRYISMFVSNIPQLKLQLHHFIVSDLRNLIKNDNILANSSLFMHSFAASLFDNNYWYTTPIGNMEGILEYKLKKSSHERTNLGELKEISNYINKIWTSPPVQPTFKYIINNFLKNLWKTKDSIKHNNEDTKEQLGFQYEPIEIIHNDNVNNYGFVYNENKETKEYHHKYLKYKLKYLILKNN